MPKQKDAPTTPPKFETAQARDEAIHDLLARIEKLEKASKKK